jgi:hypothetical protein
MRDFIEKQTKESEEAFKAINTQSRNIVIQAVSFIDNLILESASSESEIDQRVHFTKGLFSLRTFLNQYLKQQDAAIVRLSSISTLIEKFEKEEELKEKIANGEDPQKRLAGERPVNLRDVRNIKSEMESSQEFYGQDEVGEIVPEVEDI